MLLQMTSAGAMGGGVSSAIARALGAGDLARARSLVVHALVIALGMAAGFTLVLLTLGPSIYRLLGGGGEALAHALTYSNVVFAGAIGVWLANTFASIMRGSGNTLVPALALVAAAILQIPLSGALTLGWGPFPALGIAGAASAYVFGAGVATLVSGTVVLRGRLCPTRADLKLDPRRFGDILKVGAISSLSALQTVITAVVLTGLVGRFGTAALAGYGVGMRLELLQVPIAFAIGQALVVMVGTNVGAGSAARAKRIAYLGAAMAAAFCLVIGSTVALLPRLWVSIFSADPAVLEAGSAYLRTVGPFYPFMGMGIALYFASQGAARVGWPVLAGTARLIIVICGGFAVVSYAGSLPALYAVVALGMTVWGSATLYAVRTTDWSRH
jgi:putative MATE family efflux protein